MTTLQKYWSYLAVAVAATAFACVKGEQSAQQADSTARNLTLAPTESSGAIDRKSTRLNSSHSQISYAVFCLKKKKGRRSRRRRGWQGLYITDSLRSRGTTVA